MPSLGLVSDDFLDEHARLGSVFSVLRRYLPPLNFITIHYAYFIIVCLFSSVIFYVSSDPAWSISYADSLFLVVSAMTEAGLNTVNLSQMTTWQQVILFLLILFGGSIWVSIWTVLARKHVFEKRFKDIVRAERARRLSRGGSNLSLGLPMLQRFVSFRRTHTTPRAESDVPFPITTGTRVPPPPSSRRSMPSAGQGEEGAGRADPEKWNAPATRPRNGSLSDIDPAVSPDAGDMGRAGRASEAADREAAAVAPVLPNSGRPAGSGRLQNSELPDSLDAPYGQESSGGGHIAFAESLHHRGGVGGGGSGGTNADVASTGRSYAQYGRLAHRTGTVAGADLGFSGRDETFKEKAAPGTYNFLTNRTVGRNGEFHDLSREEREDLGGCEYRALEVLGMIVPLYFFLWQFLGCLGLGAWISHNQAATPLSDGISPWWLGIFNGASAFNNSGMSLLDANMIPFQNADYVVITMGLLILAGNTAFPVFLRLIIWSMLKLLVLATAETEFCGLKDTLRFILRYPRRVYTNLFPARQTWWLLFMLIWLNCVDWVGFELLNFGNPTVESIPAGSRVLDGLFQAVAVRSGGFYIVNISNLYIGLQILYVIMMYISVYPVVITMRHSNVYEERSLGIYSDDGNRDGDLESADSEPYVSAGLPTMSIATTMAAAAAAADDEQSQTQPQSQSQAQAQSQQPQSPAQRHMRRLSHGGAAAAATLKRALHQTLTLRGIGAGVSVPGASSSTAAGGRTGGGGGVGGGSGGETRISFISQQIHSQLAHDIWWLVVAVLIISTIETGHFLADPVVYSVFNVIFEVVSAYGCVGISVGLPNASYSFSGGWHTASKLVLCLVMLRGRHRGLPVALDRAVRLPGEQLHLDEEEDHRIRRSMTGRRVSLEA